MDERPRFVEDMTDEEIWKLKQNSRGVNDDTDGPIIDIIALQKEHGMERDDGKMEMYEYNRLVTGLPQHQIEDMLLQRMQKEGGEKDPSTNSARDTTTELKGELAMTMGLQLRRAYVNSIAVLDNGTLISGLDDGHVQFWRRGEMVKDARHTGTTLASMTVGSITSEEEGDRVYLAACFRITRQTDPNQFRLPPQNESERRRREAAEMQEQMIQNQLLDVTRQVKVWMYDASESNNGRVAFREELVLPNATNAVERTPSTTKVANLAGDLVCGDEAGLQIFDATRNRRFQRKMALQFQYLCDIDCMEPLHGNYLAVSVSRKSTEEISVPSSAVRLQMPTSRGVYIVDTSGATVRAVLDGHRDRVTCIRPLPDGRLLTAGGKFDATVQLWNSETLTKVTKRDEDDEIKILSESKQMKKPGYVFDLIVLPDSNGSAVFAIAAARYNTINILI
eukprot:scaffold4492_cov138-Skeletonema_marinoi.AAC.4